MNLKETIRSIPHWPIENVTFRDITTLMQNAEAYKETCDLFYERYKNMNIDKVVGIDARGFLFAAVLAYNLGVGIVPVRKQGKLPYKTISESYSLEYGKNIVEIHEDSISKGERVVIVDDLIATGGTLEAAIKLIERIGGVVVECAFVIELPELKGREKLKNYNVFSLVQFEGE